MKKLVYATLLLCAAAACRGRRQAALPMPGGVPAPAAARAVPPCIRRMIDSTQKLEPALQLTEIRRYRYHGAMVYAVGAPCCDQYNAVYDSACHFLFAPSGGFTGRGDGTHPDFYTEAVEDSLIWQQKRK